MRVDLHQWFINASIKKSENIIKGIQFDEKWK